MTGLAALTTETLSAGLLAAVPLSFAAGLVMGLNPCCLALYPAAVSCCTEGCSTRPAGFTPSRALAFVLGTATATTVLGLAAAMLGRAMVGLGGAASVLVAMVPLAMGMHSLGWLRLPLPQGREVGARGGLWGAYVGGLLLSLVLGPCGTPALAAILSYAATRGSLAGGALLLLAYGLGNGLPLLVAGATAGTLSEKLASRGWGVWVDRLSGVAMLGLGFWLLWQAA